MPVIADALGPVFALILFGAVLRRARFTSDAFWPGVERLTYFVLFPALLVHKLALADFGQARLAPLVLAVTAVVVATALLLFTIRRITTTSGPAFTSVFQGGIRLNTYIGLACANALYGRPGLVMAAIVVAILIPVVNVLCVLCFTLAADDEPFRWRTMADTLARNPLVLACALGIALNAARIGLPGWIGPILDLLGAAALPLGLIAVGAAIRFRARQGAMREIGAASVVKFVIHPGLMLAAASTLPLDPLARSVLLLFATLPTASSAYILARQLGGDTELMANMITAQTLLAFVTIPAWLGIAAWLW